MTRRARIIRMYCEVNLCEALVVQEWSAGKTSWDEIAQEKIETDFRWESMRQFDLDAYEKACEFAMNLTMERKPPTELAVFEDGRAQAKGVAPIFDRCENHS